MIPENSKSSLYEGEVALVTGAASGLGKACARSLLDRGASVVGFDINPDIVNQFPEGDFIGIECDMGNPDSIRAAMKRFEEVKTKLDMLVLNAGIFPPGCAIADINLADWQRVFRINVEGNLVLMSLTHPLLKLSRGRVAVMGGQRVKAPAASTVTYSSSKAALVQLARVAALEWGPDGIRVNIINPGRICDTGIFTEDVLQKRAAHYNMTVDDYKRDNVLHTEITSREIGEAVAEVMGPVFAYSTGMQVPIDGGDSRVI